MTVDVMVNIVRDLPITMPDGTVDHTDAVRIFAPSDRAESGQKHVAFCAESLKTLQQSDVRSRYVRNAAWSLANYERPYDDVFATPANERLAWGEQVRQLTAEYTDAIEPKLLEALAGAT